MIYGFAKQSGGTVRISTAMGEGTTVEILLPWGGAAVGGNDRRVFEKTVRGTVEGGTERILVVEDDNLMRGRAVSTLQSLGYRIKAVSSADEAVEVLANEEFDLIFSDIVMPGSLNGIALAALVRKRWPSTQVLLTTGYYDDAHEKSPDILVFRKPYRGHEMAAAVRSAIDGVTIPSSSRERSIAPRSQV